MPRVAPRAHRGGMTTLHAGGEHDRRPGFLARMRAIVRDGDSATTPLVLLVLVSGALAVFITVTLTLVMLLYELE